MPLRVKRRCPEAFNSTVHLSLAVLQAVKEQAFLCSAGWVSAWWRGTRVSAERGRRTWQGLSEADALGGGLSEADARGGGLSEADARGRA